MTFGTPIKCCTRGHSASEGLTIIAELNLLARAQALDALR